MRGKYLITGLILLALSLGAGWWRASFAVSQKVESTNQWDELQGVNIDQARYSEIAKALHSADMFPMSAEEEKIKAEIKASGEVEALEDVPKFPSIIGASVLNGVPHVHLLLKDKSLLKVKAGDELDSGWQLKIVDLQRVRAVYGEDEKEFWVTDYDIKAAKDNN